MIEFDGEIKRGHVTVEHTVWCVSTYSDTKGATGCLNWLQESGSARSVQREVRRQGWVKTREYGWVCPSCYRQIQEARKA